MILLQLSAAYGPMECCLVVSLALKEIVKRAKKIGLSVIIVEEELGIDPKTFKSVLLKLEGDGCVEFARSWNGTLKWIFESPYRKKHKRKNWFIISTIFELSKSNLQNSGNYQLDSVSKSHIKFEACRSSGPGGQHANKTSSAIRATHIETGISVKVQSERSQHANKRLALALIEAKLHSKAQHEADNEKLNKHQQHHKIERGNAIRVFKGLNSIED